ncbi:HEAT repeat domain-containing protein [Propionibacteriaceae bacterium Y2011]|uniref:HEAT repeat domain-containing protein n=1 Tax=Microlunatus sp. Y2014 TaxID=3418488 RepID=UPI003B46C4BB
MVVVPAWLLQATLAVLASSAVVMVLVIVVARVTRYVRQRQIARLVAPLRPQLLAVAAGEDDDSTAQRDLVTAPARSRRPLDDAIVGLLSKIAGPPARALVGVLRSHGVTDLADARLRSLSSVRRARAAWTLGLMRDGTRAPAIARLLADRSVEVRITAARALGLIADPAQAGAVLASVCPDQRGRRLPSWAAVEALAPVGSLAADELTEALRDSDPEPRTVAATVIGHVPVMAGARAVRERLAVEDDPAALAALATALGEIGRADDVAVLARLASEQTDDAVRVAAIEALGTLGEVAGIDHLAAWLADSRVVVAEAAGLAMARLGPAGTARLRALRSAGPAGTDHGGADHDARVGRVVSYALTMGMLRTGGEAVSG